ncbi:zinc finger protein 502 [Agrilus planipennis]|uniref:Zinc finger protein 502 n=1 Tax=Agrilus planipennis TaxID=224129 RepID=A0A1W4W9Z8_AGRPL|nr:zinc finger protein 502 [Agrilus planipennis]XP_018320823.1 zinc finger protein 502 [Agrilus planipennis]
MEDRGTVLRDLKICRFCLDENGPFTNIYEKDPQQVVPLPLQMMACVSIEVFPNDGMPQLICRACRYQTQQAYRFKTTCKKADDALKLFLATGNLVKPAELSNESKKRNLLPIQNESGHTKKSKTNDGNSPVVYSVTTDNKESQSELQISTKGENETEMLDFDQNSKNQISSEESETQEEGNENSITKVSHVRTDVFSCPHCERSFPLQQLLDLHMKNHDRQRNFECDECGRKFFTKYDLGKHFQTHLNSKPFTCVVCRKQFSRESLLHRHEKIHVQAPKYLCTECDRTFLTSEDLDAHMERHKKRRPFSCRLCNKSFVFKQGLERHELSHADQKPHKCNYCEASFTSPLKLTRHITSHAGLRPYPCKLCGRTFLLSHHLTRHMRSHYAAKSPNAQPIGQHKCDMCSMSFRRKDSLINHSAIHSMVNLKCVICNTEFENAKMVKEHITTHLAGLPYPCDKCDYSFDTQDQLEEHELKHAEMEYEEQIEREVTEEAMQQQQQRTDHYSGMGDDGDEAYSGEEDIAEFSITSADNPEIIRRSKRERKIKNFADFLKDELGSDMDEDASQDIPNNDEEEDEDDLLYKPPPPTTVNETIKPVVRTEGTKVYTRKNAPEKPKPVALTTFVTPTAQSASIQLPTHQLDQISQLPLLDNMGLSKDAANAFPPNKNYVDMKIGNKLVRVQKLIMSKAEIQAMAKEGKIEMKGNTILLKKKQTLNSVTARTAQSLQNVTIDSIFQEAAASVEPSNVHRKQQNSSNNENDIFEEEQEDRNESRINQHVSEVCN